MYFNDENVANFQCKGASFLFATASKVNFNYFTLQLINDPGSVMRLPYSCVSHNITCSYRKISFKGLLAN